MENNQPTSEGRICWMNLLWGCGLWKIDHAKILRCHNQQWGLNCQKRDFTNTFKILCRGWRWNVFSKHVKNKTNFGDLTIFLWRNDWSEYSVRVLFRPLNFEPPNSKMKHDPLVSYWVCRGCLSPYPSIPCAKPHKPQRLWQQLWKLKQNQLKDEALIFSFMNDYPLVN